MKSWDGKHVYRRDTVGMIAKEGFPALRRWPPSPGHVFCNRALADIDPELEQLAIDSRRSRQGIGNAYLEHELANVRGDFWPAATPAWSRAPTGSETSAMPTDNGARSLARAALWNQTVEPAGRHQGSLHQAASLKLRPGGLNTSAGRWPFPFASYLSRFQISESSFHLPSRVPAISRLAYVART
jgi:hypothetical protein